MGKRSYQIRWLGPEDTAQIAQLEAQAHPTEHRFGERLIFAELQGTEYDGKNLSVGLYYNRTLVGMLLAFVVQDRQEMADFFGVSVPPELGLGNPAIYLADYAVLPRHRRVAGILLTRLRAVVIGREELRKLSVEMFATTEYADKWTAQAPRFARLGWHLGGRHTFHDAKLGQTLHWLHFHRESKPAQELGAAPEKTLPDVVRRASTHAIAGALTAALVDATTAWPLLARDWNAMAAATSAEGAAPSWEYVRTSWRHLGSLEEPFIAVAVRNDRAAAIAPLYIALVWQLGGTHRVIRNIPQVAYPLLISGDEADGLDAVAECLAVHHASWDSVELDVPAAQDKLLRLFSQRLRKRGYLVSRQPGAVRAGVAVRGDANALLAQSPGSLRESYSRARAELSAQGKVHFETARVEDTPAAFERYLHLELEAPEDEIGYGAGISARHITFHREAAQHAAGTGMRVGFLFVGDTLAAGVVGFLFQRHLQLVHITRSTQFAELGASQVALGQLIDECFAQRACDFIDISSLQESETAGWANHSCKSTVLRVQQGSLIGWLAHCKSLISRGGSE